jgi:hypothetical protein
MIMKISNCMLKAFVCLLVVVSVVGSEPVVQADESGADEPVSVFVPVGVYVDSGEKELGVYQIEIKVIKGDAKIISVDGGDHAAFKDPPPFYDPAALKGGRIILAAFSTQDDLPTGKTKVATLHMYVTGDVAAEYEVIVKVAGDGEGKEIGATVTVE